MSFFDSLLVTDMTAAGNRYVLEEAFIKLFIMSWNEIAGNYNEYLDFWNKNLEDGDELLHHKTRLLMAAARKGR